MIGIIITGHGRFAGGLLSAVTQVIGPQEQVAAVDFPPEMNTRQLDAALAAALATFEQPDNVVFFTDLLGGSPFRSAVQLLSQQGQGDVVAGSNLQMLAEMLLDREDYHNTADFVSQALACGHRGLVSFAQNRSDPAAGAAEPEEGI